MKNRLLPYFLVFFVALAAIKCKSGEKDWQTIAPGYSYKYEESNRVDSFTIMQFNYKDLDGFEINLPADNLQDIKYFVFANTVIKGWIPQLQKGITGQLKIAGNVFFQSLSESRQLILYTKEKNNSMDFKKDTIWIRQHSFGKSFRFVSNKDAYAELTKENTDFVEFLENNPIPNSIEISIPSVFWNEKSMDSIEALIKTNTVSFSQITYPKSLLKTQSSLKNSTVLINFKN